MSVARRSATMLVVAVVLGAAGCDAQRTGSTVEDVVLAVVDEFDPPSPNPAGPPDVGPNDNCTYRTNEVGSKGGSEDIPPGVAHGTVVLEQLRQQLHDGLGADPTVATGAYLPTDPWVRDVYRWDAGGRRVILMGIDTRYYNTHEVSDRIDKLTSTMRQAHSVERFVLNLSFIVAPCDVEIWLDNALKEGTLYPSPDALLHAYQESISKNHELDVFEATLEKIVNGSTSERVKAKDLWDIGQLRDTLPPATLIHLFYSALETAFPQGIGRTLEDSWPIAGDPLYLRLKQLVASSTMRVVPVGAAGNGMSYTDATGVHFLQLDFPFAPAMWDTVVSASAAPRANEPGLDRAGYSNSGEIALDGRFAYHHDSPSGPKTYQLDGTSFAAPRLSYAEAIYLRHGGTVNCQGSSGSAVPPLGYSDLGLPPWTNMPVGLAGPQYCTGFVSLATP